MDQLNFLESEKLLKFFHRKKTEMSCMENPHTFLRLLRDHDLIPEDRYQMVSRMENKEETKGAIYDMLDQFEKEQSQRIQEFWSCVFQEIIMDQYPTLRLLHKNFMDELRGRVKKGETGNGNGEQRSTTRNCNDAAQPSPSSQRNMSKEIHVSSPMEKREKTDVRPFTNSQLPVTCRNLEGRLNIDKLATGKRCIFFNKRWLTPPEFEKRAGMRSKNWKMSIRYNGFTLKDCMEKWKMIPPVYRGTQ